MRIAISISGHTRNLTLIPILNKLKSMGIQFDTFVSSWNTSGYRISMYDHDKNNFDFSNIDIPNLKKLEIENDGLKIEEVEKACFLNEKVIEPGNYNPEEEFKRKYQIISMFRKCQRSIDIIEGDYDFVLRTRFDCVFDIDTVLRYSNQLKESNSILVPFNWGAGDESHPGGGRICDSFAFGPSDLIKKYSKVYDYIRNPETSEYMLNNGVWFCPHSILLHHLRKEEVNYIKDHIEYDIIR